MDEKQILAFIRCPASLVVDLALAMANLTWKESTAIQLCGRKAMTQERAAELTGYSVDAMQKWYRSAIKKLSASWTGIWWVEKLIEN